MKPVKLILSGYSSYVYEEIDFSKLSNIFLISGDTGSGKSSIFNAIIYALFGDNANINTIIGDKIDFFVELFFVHNDEKYRIKRGLKNDKAYVEFEYKEEIITKITAVKDHIVNILGGIDSKRFKQIYMLEQGEFDKFLTLGTKDRKEILSNLFDIKRFEDIEFKIKDIERTLKLERKNLELEIERISDFVKNELNFQKEEYFILENYEKNIELAINKIELKISRNSLIEKEIINIDLELKKKEKLKSILEDNKEKVEKYNNALKELEKYKNLLKVLLKENNDILEYNFLENEKLLEKNKIFIKNFDEKESLLNKNKEYDILLEKINLNIDTKKKVIEENEKNLEDISKIYVKKEENITEKNNYEKLKIKYESELSNLKSFENDKDTIQKNKNSIEENKNEYIDLKNKIKLLTEEILSKKEVYKNNRYGEIASKLTEGEKCPVCGNTHHIEYAKFDKNITEKYISELEDELKVCEKKFGDLKSNLNNCFIKNKSSFENINKILDYCSKTEYTAEIELDFLSSKNNKNIPLKDLLDEYIKVYNNKKTNLDNEVKNLNLKISEYNEKQKEYDDKILKFRSLENEIKKVKMEIEELEKNKKEIENKILVNITKIDTLETLDIPIDKLENDTKFLSKEIELNKQRKNEYDKKEKEYKEKEIELNTTIKLLENVKEYKFEDILLEIEEINKYLYESNLKKNELLKEKENNVIIISKLEEYLSDKKEKINDYKKVNKEYNIIKRIIVDGKGKSSFSAFVLSKYFDEMIKLANKRLKNIFNGEFEIIREYGNQRGEAGLDIYVLDKKANKNRAINTLSGGELFSVSLSMALSVSDVIIMESGVSKLDMMFIDEGFGTLDTDILNKILNTLYEISNIGVSIALISHRQELKEAIESKILVSKNKKNIELKDKTIVNMMVSKIKIEE